MEIHIYERPPSTYRQIDNFNNNFYRCRKVNTSLGEQSHTNYTHETGVVIKGVHTVGPLLGETVNQSLMSSWQMEF